MSARSWIFIGIVLAVAGFAAFVVMSPAPVAPGIEVQGDGSADAETLAWIGLGTGVVGLLTALVGLAKEIIALRRT